MVNWSLECLYLTEEAVKSAQKRELFYTKNPSPLTTLLRIPKLIGQGWKISRAQLLKLAVDLNSHDLLDPKVINDLLQGFYTDVEKKIEFEKDVITTEKLMNQIDVTYEQNFKKEKA